MSASLKAAKVFPLGDAISATVELFLPNAQAWPSVFARALHALQLAAQRFCATMATGAAPADMLAMLRAILEGKPPGGAGTAEG